jgi:hypothetical protein
MEEMIPTFLGIGCEEDINRMNKYHKTKSCPAIKSFFIDGQLEDELGYDICSFVSGEIKDVEVQDAQIYNFKGDLYPAKIVLVHDKNNDIYGYLISTEDNVKDVIQHMKNLLEKYKCI